MASLINNLIARADENGGCTESTCPVGESIYGYRPSLAATLIFLIVFAVSGLVYLFQGIKTRTWAFTIAMTLGAISETLGYVAKFMLWQDPFSDMGFKMSVATLTFAPAFYAAGIYYTLKHICLTFGAEFSRLRPKWYTWIFISCDFLSIVLQAMGGAISAATDSMSLLNTATNIMIAGLASQVFTLIVFGILSADYGVKVYGNKQHLNPATESLRNTMKFRLFVIALWIAYFGILIRCCYRVAELAQGWTDNPILTDEGLFIGLDSVPIGIAAVVLNIWHPGWCFPKEQQDVAAVEEKQVGSDQSSRVEEARA